MGFQFIFIRGLSLLPGPVIFGSVIDSACIIWKESGCGVKGNCQEYNLEDLSKYLAVLAVLSSGKPNFLWSPYFISLVNLMR